MKRRLFSREFKLEAVIELGADVTLSRQASLGITYGGQYGGGTIDQSIQGNFTVKF